MPTLEATLTDLYSREINVSLTSFWDAGWRVRIGDDMNGYVAEETFRSEDFGRIADWLLAHADDSERRRGTDAGTKPADTVGAAPAGYTGPWRWWGPFEQPDGRREWRWEIVPTRDSPFTGWLDSRQCPEWWDGKAWIGCD